MYFRHWRLRSYLGVYNIMWSLLKNILICFRWNGKAESRDVARGKANNRVPRVGSRASRMDVGAHGRAAEGHYSPTDQYDPRLCAVHHLGSETLFYRGGIFIFFFCLCYVHSLCYPRDLIRVPSLVGHGTDARWTFFRIINYLLLSSKFSFSWNFFFHFGYACTHFRVWYIDFFTSN